MTVASSVSVTAVIFARRFARRVPDLLVYIQPAPDPSIGVAAAVVEEIRGVGEER